MHAVTGVGGIFFRAKDPLVLAEWYEKNLGVTGMDQQGGVWVQQKGPTVFAPFEADTKYFGSDTQSFMLNFRVDDLDAMLAQLGAAGVTPVKDIEDMAGVGRFAWITDPEGNRVELWQPTE